MIFIVWLSCKLSGIPYAKAYGMQPVSFNLSNKATELSFLHGVVAAFQQGITTDWNPQSHVLKCISHCTIGERTGGEKAWSFRRAIHQVFPRALPGQGFMVPVWFPNALFSHPLSATL